MSAGASLAALTARASSSAERWLWDAGRAARLDAVSPSSHVNRALAGRCVILKTTSQLETATALLALDGFAARIVLCPPDLDPRYLASVVETTGADAAVGDPANLSAVADAAPALERFDIASMQPAAATPTIATRWLMFTSGTTGPPKIVVHDLAGLTGAFRDAPQTRERRVWGTFYDVRRYGGLQILLRALIGGASMALSSADEDPGAFLRRLGGVGVTHLSGTPSHWRRALMRPEIADIAPRYLRLSGEVADQALLDRLQARFPAAAVGHAYASTEAGVGFEVTDGREGVPAEMFDAPDASRANGVEMRLVDGALQLRSTRTAHGYAGVDAPSLAGRDGFVDTGDMMERCGDRYVFKGRRDGVINVGGLKVHPEEVEAVINRHPGVQVSRVHTRRSPITGAVVAAEIVAADGEAPPETVIRDVIDLCRTALDAHKVPVSVRLRDSLAMTAGGKLDRRDA